MFGSPLYVLPLRLCEGDRGWSKYVLCCCCGCCRDFIVGKIFASLEISLERQRKKGRLDLLACGVGGIGSNFGNLKLLLSCLLEGKAWTHRTVEVREEEEVTGAVILTLPAYLA